MPKAARPGAIHEHGDFGDVISMDGMVSPGQIRKEINSIFTTLLTKVHYITPPHALRPEHLNRQPKHCCRGGSNVQGLQSYILVMDAATEFNSDEFG